MQALGLRKFKGPADTSRRHTLQQYKASHVGYLETRVSKGSKVCCGGCCCVLAGCGLTSSKPPSRSPVTVAEADRWWPAGANACDWDLQCLCLTHT